MAPPTKEASHVGISTSQSVAQHSNPQAKTGARTDAVSLEVPVKVHGSRVNATAGASPQTEPFSEQTITMIVFPQGAVVRMTVAVNVGQMLVITNLKSRQDAICRVVKVRSFPNLQSYVEVEFTQPQAKFWGVYFSSKGATGEAHPYAPAQPIKSKPIEVSTPRHEVSVPKPVETTSPREATPLKPSPVSAPPPPAQASASSRVEPEVKIEKPPLPVPHTAPRSLTHEDQGRAEKTRVADGPVQPLVSPLHEIHEIRVPQHPQPDAEPEVEPLAVTVETDSKASHAAPASRLPVSAGRGFGALGVAAKHPAEDAVASAEPIRELADTRLERKSSVGRRTNWALVAACSAVLVIAASGGVWYFHFRAAASAPSASNSSASPMLRPPVTATQTPASPVLPPGSTSASAAPLAATNKPGAVSSAPLAANPRRDTAPKSDASSKPAPKPELQPSSQVVVVTATAPKSDLNPQAMNAHPLTAVRKTDTENQAPALDSEVPANAPAELPGMLASNPSIPAPPPTGPLTVGGRIKEPKIIVSTRPVYPVVARQARVEGDVVIDTILDKHGNVSHVKVVSGPAMLRDAAVDTLRHWKFQPTELDGQPVEVEMFVTIRFRL